MNIKNLKDQILSSRRRSKLTSEQPIRRVVRPYEQRNGSRRSDSVKKKGL